MFCHSISTSTLPGLPAWPADSGGGDEVALKTPMPDMQPGWGHHDDIILMSIC